MSSERFYSSLCVAALLGVIGCSDEATPDREQERLDFRSMFVAIERLHYRALLSARGQGFDLSYSGVLSHRSGPGMVPHPELGCWSIFRKDHPEGYIHPLIASFSLSDIDVDPDTVVTINGYQIGLLVNLADHETINEEIDVPAVVAKLLSDISDSETWSLLDEDSTIKLDE